MCTETTLLKEIKEGQNKWKDSPRSWVCTCVLNCFSHVRFFVTLCTIAHQASMSIEFSRQEYWSGLLCPPPGDLPNPGIKPASFKSLALASEFFIPLVSPGKPQDLSNVYQGKQGRIVVGMCRSLCFTFSATRQHPVQEDRCSMLRMSAIFFP